MLQVRAAGRTTAMNWWWERLFTPGIGKRCATRRDTINGVVASGIGPVLATFERQKNASPPSQAICGRPCRCLLGFTNLTVFRSAMGCRCPAPATATAPDRKSRQGRDVVHPGCAVISQSGAHIAFGSSCRPRRDRKPRTSLSHARTRIPRHGKPWRPASHSIRSRH